MRNVSIIGNIKTKIKLIENLQVQVLILFDLCFNHNLIYIDLSNRCNNFCKNKKNCNC